MIINHKYRFIFLKTRKTAGTSIEIALSRYCDEGDVITPITVEDEALRKKLGFRGPQNYEVPRRFWTRVDWLNRVQTGSPKRFIHHSTAEFVRANIDPAIWNDYYKFSFERDPFDKAISRYYWRTRDPRPDIDEYLDSSPPGVLSNWSIYTIEDHIVVDHLGRYETLTDDLAMVQEKLRLPGELALPSAKGGYRKNRDHYSRILNQRARRRVEIVCAREMAALGYGWTEAES